MLANSRATPPVTTNNIEYKIMHNPPLRGTLLDIENLSARDIVFYLSLLCIAAVYCCTTNIRSYIRTTTLTTGYRQCILSE